MEALNDISILSWNIRGAQNNNSRRHLKEVIRKYNPIFLAILETHVPYARLSSFWTTNGYTPVHIVEANGHSGGIWLLKQAATTFIATVTDSNQYSITFSVNHGDALSHCTCVYASPNPTLRNNFWDYLVHISQTIVGPWMLIGDFNETLLPSDQRGGIFHHVRASRFAQLMDHCGLLDLTTTGGRFTWHRNNNGIRILSKKLDRGLANVEWRLAFPEAFVEILCRFHSDHNPLLLRFGGLPIIRGPRPFRFEAAWIDHNDYSALVESAWRSSSNNTITALNNVRQDSITFNHEVFGNIFKRKKHIENRLKGVQLYLERVDSLHHVLLERDLQREYNHILFQEEMHWYQKSREKWVKFGDKNSAFFHTQTIIRRKRNRVHRLQLPNGTWTTDSFVLQSEAHHYYKNFFSSNQFNQAIPFFNGFHPTVDEEGRQSLLRPVTKEEVYAALNSMKPYKAPGPDGFQCIFFKQYWHIVGDDIFNMVKTAFHTGYFDPAISETLITLIPKEIIHFMRRSKKKKGFVAFKLDLEKAFDNAKNSQLRFINDLFARFSQASGLKINLSKSRAFYSGGIPQAKINKLTSISGIRSTSSLDKYLGFPILKGRAKRSDFHFIIDKMQSRLASWKNRLLNKPGRLALGSSVLTSIPTYYMQIAWLPQSICDSIDQTTRTFIWRDSNNKGIHLVGWNKVARPKQYGGLGIRPAREANISLLGKLVWDMVHHSKKLWVDILSSKYVDGPSIFLASNSSSGSPTWSSIIQAKNILKDGYTWRAGSGSSSFWFSHCTKFGRLGTIVPYIDIHDLQLSVRDVLSSGNPHTQILYTQLPPMIFDTINNSHMKFNASIEDTFIWTNNKNGSYTTKSGYDWLLSLRDPGYIGFTNPDFFSNMDVYDWIKMGTVGTHSLIFSAGVWSMVETFKNCFTITSNGGSVDRFIKWNNNNFSCTILNVDGSCLGSPTRSGFGGIIRNTFGHYLAGFSGYIQGSSDILYAELYAIYKGLLLAINMGIDELVCYSDSLHCINLIKGPQVKFHMHAVLIQDIKDLISQSNVSLCHTLREGNQCADFFAKLGASSDADFTNHDCPPEGVQDLLKNDALGILFQKD
ncbi:unnamed protein product [Trifolium pratense]|uniref:Uncharacterized protein n=1 Tax=Trifolium pratense TaxID=57577 RepID=A0ACB0IVF4_TRIPR|nr:unnamed protein product [Trifolium pratense]